MPGFFTQLEGILQILNGLDWNASWRAGKHKLISIEAKHFWQAFYSEAKANIYSVSVCVYVCVCVHI